MSIVLGRRSRRLGAALLGGTLVAGLVPGAVLAVVGPVFTTQPVGAGVGQPFATQPVVSIMKGANVDESAGGTVTLAIVQGSGTSGAHLTCSGTGSGGRTFPVVTGVATAAGCSIDMAGSGYVLRATWSGGGQGTSAPFTIGGGGGGQATHLVFSTQPGGGPQNVAWPTQPVVRVLDANNNLVNTNSVVVTLTIGTNPGGGALVCTSGNSRTTVGGIATFSGCYITAAGNGYTLIASATGLTPATSNPFNITGATKVGFTTQPGGGTPGVAWAVQPVVAIQDANGVTVPSASATITLAIAAGTGTAGAILTCTGGLSKATTNGVASFSGCAIDRAGTGYRLTASATGLTSATSNLFNISGATKLGFTTQPARGRPAAAFATQPVVAIQDANGVTVTSGPSSTATVTLAIGSNPGGGVLSCTGGLSKAAVAGLATFAGCAITTVGVGYTLVASSTGLTGATSALFDVADRLAFSTQPSAAQVGVAFPTQPVVAVRAGTTNTSTHDQATVVTLAIKAGTGAPGAVLTCTGGLTRTAVNGLATFSGCAIDRASPTSPANPYQLVATAANLTSATSNAFVVGAAASITLTTSAPIPPGAHNPVITWGQGFFLGVQFAASGSGKQVQLQGTRDGIGWATITTLTMDGSGHASYFYTPVTNLYYRAVFAGTADLAAATSNQVRTVVREIAILRPTNSGAVKSIARNTSITFTTTVRPARPELAPARVSFYFYRRIGSSWVLQAKRDVIIDSAGRARTTFTFSTSGQWYVRSQANPTPYNANSVMSPLERYSVS